MLSWELVRQIREKAELLEKRGMNMKESEASTILKAEIVHHPEYSIFSEALGIAIQALEKQTSKKPTPIDYEKYIDVIDNARFLRGAYWCPNCKRVVKSGSFCSDCGQKLDWSDAE